MINFYVNAQAPSVLFTSSETHKLVALIGQVKLLEISEKGDTASVLDKIGVEVVVSTITEKKEKRIKTFFIDKKGRVTLLFDYNGMFKVEFTCENYQTKYFIINTEKKLEWEEDFRYGFDFPFEVNLFSSKKEKKRNYQPQQVAMIKYYPETGYFDYK